MRDDADEFGQAEYRQAPWGVRFSDFRDPAQRDFMPRGLSTVRIDEHVGIDPDHSRSIRSYSASRSAISTAGGLSPSITVNLSLNLDRAGGCGRRRARSASSTNVRSEIPAAAACCLALRRSSSSMSSVVFIR